MKLKIKAYMSKEEFFKLPSAEQKKKAEKYDVYKNYLKEGKSGAKKAAKPSKTSSKPMSKTQIDDIKQAQEELDNALAELAWYKKEKLDYSGMDEYEKEEFKEGYNLAKHDVDMAKRRLREAKGHKSKISYETKKALDDLLSNGSFETEKLKTLPSLLNKSPELKQAFDAAKPELKQFVAAIKNYDKIYKSWEKLLEDDRASKYKHSEDPKKKKIWDEYLKQDDELTRARDKAWDAMMKSRKAWSEKFLKDLPYKDPYYTR